MYSFEEQVKEKLQLQEKLIETFSGRIEPTNIVMKLLPDMYEITVTNMAIRGAITNKRIIVYKQEIQKNEFLFDMQLEDITTYTLKNEILSGSLLINTKDNQIKFSFKKECLAEIKNALSKVVSKVNGY
ncbi:PH domain-containing protein [Clostridium hydrogenum]|uniref:PH domain-containing protein n=1 Tax=Clostridium hydrogenum TaxID=2855764 RepID=UPI001F40650A|nr:PH domain-containing protein [Clostridium hydrogenum]